MDDADRAEIEIERDLAQALERHRERAHADALQGRRAEPWTGCATAEDGGSPCRASALPDSALGPRVCLGCGEPLTPRRLAVLPQAVRCVDCQHDHETRVRRHSAGWPA